MNIKTEENYFFPVYRRNLGVPLNWRGLFTQFTRNFIRPYGWVDAPLSDPEILARLKDFTCKWISRPRTAISEMADTTGSNLPVIKYHSQTIINAEVVGNVEKYLTLARGFFARLAQKRGDTAPPTQEDVKKLVRHFLDQNIGEEFDDFIDQCYEAIAGLFTISVQCMVARTLFRNPEEFGRKVKKEDGNDFDENPRISEIDFFYPTLLKANQNQRGRHLHQEISRKAQVTWRRPM